MINEFFSAPDYPLSKTEKAILKIIFKSGFQTQAAIAEITNLKQQSVSRLLNGLIQNDFLIEGEKVTTGKKGYPCSSFILNPNKMYSFGVSLMSDAISLTLINFCGEIQADKNAVIASMTIENVMSWLEQSIFELIQENNIQMGTVIGIGVGMPGSYLGERKGFNVPYYLNEWNEVDITQLFLDNLGIEAWSDNDGNVAAVGESANGVGKWAQNFAYLYLSAGVGGGIILNGELWRGKYGNAGEFAGGLPPNIYPFPNLELLRQLVSRYDEKMDSITQLVDNFNIDWLGVDAWINKVADSLSIISSNAAAILDLEAIVLGGRIPTVLAEKVITVIELYDQKRHGLERPVAKLVPAQATGNAAAIGAAMLPFNQMIFS